MTFHRRMAKFHLPIKHGDLPIKHGDLPLKHVDLPMKHDLFRAHPIFKNRKMGEFFMG